MNSLDIQIPALSNNMIIQNTLESLDKLVTDIILWLAYGIALLCGFKFIIYLLNGFATKSHMGARTMEDTPFRY